MNLFTPKGFAFLFLLLSQPLFGQTEICWNRIDDDGDGKIDCQDDQCLQTTFCFECDSDLHIIFDNTYFGTLSIENSVYTNLFKIKGVSAINGAAFNHLDGHVYASAKRGVGSLAGLFLLEKNGKVQELDLWNTDGEIYFMGAFDGNGRLYQAHFDSEIVYVDVNDPKLEYKSTGIKYQGGTDFAFSRINGLLYTVRNDNVLIEINVNTKEVQKYELAGSINQEDGYFGSMWSNSDGAMFASNGISGKVYSIDIENKVATEVLNATGNFSWFDGLNCFVAPSPFEVNCTNGRDDDGDGLADCDDPDCEKSNQCITEICDNGIDDDGDGQIDCKDAECQAMDFCVEICDNGIDDDGDGLVDDEDSDCSTTTGNLGGTESNQGMINAIAKRNLERRKNNHYKVKFPIYEDKVSEFKNGRNEIDLRAFIVEDAIPESVIHITTPEDLIDLTNANDVFAIDIMKDSKRVASTLVLKTTDEVYEHSKNICDRLDGAQIMDLSTILYQDKQLIMSEILHRNGTKEYVISLSVYFEDGFANVENFWKKENHTQRDGEFVTMQIWANSIKDLNVLLSKSLDKINAFMPCLLYTSPSPRDATLSRMPSSA